MKKKVLSTILAFTMVVTALAGCGGAAQAPAATSTDTQTATTEATPAADNAAADTAVYTGHTEYDAAEAVRSGRAVGRGFA